MGQQGKSQEFLFLEDIWQWVQIIYSEVCKLQTN